MGIKQLMNIINEKAGKAVRKSRLYHFSNKVIACDANMAIYQFLIALQNSQHHYTLTDESGNPTSHLSGIFYRTIQFLSYGIKPIWVFDGKAPDLKITELKRRKSVKSIAREKILAQRHESGKLETASTAASESKPDLEEEPELVQVLPNPIKQIKFPWNPPSSFDHFDSPEPEKSEKPAKSTEKKKKSKLVNLKKSIEKIKNLTENGLKVGEQAKKVQEKIKTKSEENKNSLIDLTESKVQEDSKDSKSPKDLKDLKDSKDSKDPKDAKDSKDSKDSKESEGSEEPKKKFKKLTVRQWQIIQEKKYKDELEEIETSLRSRIADIISSPLNDLITNDYMCVGESDEEEVGINKELEQIATTLENKGYRKK